MPHPYSWQLLRAGNFHLDGGSMFGIVPKAIWSTLTTPDDANRITLQTNCLLLDDQDGNKILIETGYGDKWSDKERGFYDLQRRCVANAVREVGVAPEEISHVVLTHLHFDHAAGLTTLSDEGEPVSVFTNAKIHVQQREWDDARANRSTMTRTYLKDHLEPVADQIVTHDGECEIFPRAGIRVFGRGIPEILPGLKVLI